MKVPAFPILFSALASLSAQSNTAIFPPSLVNTDGEYGNPTIPLSGGVSRVQMIYESYQLTLPNLAAISAVGFRQDGGNAAASTGYQLQLQILAGTTTKDSTTASALFANNYDGTPIVAFAKKVFALPTLPVPPSTGASPNFVVIPLDAPYVYQRAKNLLFEYVITANSNASQPFNYYLDQSNGLSLPSTTYGTGCPNSANKVAALTSSGGLLGGFWGASMSNGPASQAVGFIVSGAQTNVPLSGAPGCSLLVDLTGSIVVATLSSAAGTAAIGAPVPNDLIFDQRPIFTQIGMVDPFANSLGVVVSNGAKTILNSPPRMAIVQATGSATATTGQLLPQVAIVSRFDY